MSDDEFGDFSDFTSVEEVKANQEIVLDNYGRPVEYLSTAVSLLNHNYFQDLCSLLCEPQVFEKIDLEKIEIPDENGLENNKDHLNSDENAAGLNSEMVTYNISDFFIKQGEFFCKNVWPGLSIRSTFLRNINLNETAGFTNDTLPLMTENDVDPNKSVYISEYKKPTAKDFLGFDLPDLGFMISGSIQWPSEYLRQI